MYCPQCQAKLDPKSKFCSRCGRPVDGQAEPEKRLPVSATLGAALIVLILSAGGAYAAKHFPKMPVGSSAQVAAASAKPSTSPTPPLLTRTPIPSPVVHSLAKYGTAVAGAQQLTMNKIVFDPGEAYVHEPAAGNTWLDVNMTYLYSGTYSDQLGSVTVQDDQGDIYKPLTGVYAIGDPRIDSTNPFTQASGAAGTTAGRDRGLRAGFRLTYRAT